MITRSNDRNRRIDLAALALCITVLFAGPLVAIAQWGWRAVRGWAFSIAAGITALSVRGRVPGRHVLVDDRKRLNLSRLQMLGWIAMAACGPHAYLKTVGDFAETAGESITALQPAAGLRSELCHLGARYDFALRRSKGTVLDPKTGEPIIFVEFESKFAYPEPEPGEVLAHRVDEGHGPTWAAKCAERAASDALVNKALMTLSAYAKALGKVAGDDFPGNNITGLGNAASGLAKAISSKSTVSAIAVSLAKPISSIAKAIGDRWKRNELADVIAKNHAAVKTIIEKIREYLKAISHESQLARSNLMDALRASDATLVNDRPTVMTLIDAVSKYLAAIAAGTPNARHEFEEALKTASQALRPGDVLPEIMLGARRLAELDDIDHAISSTRDALEKLADAEANLVAANGKDDAVELADVLGDLAMIIDDTQAVRVAIQGKADN